MPLHLTSAIVTTCDDAISWYLFVNLFKINIVIFIFQQTDL